MGKRILSTLGTFLMGCLGLGLLTLLPAWRLDYWQAWVFMITFMISVTGLGLYLSLRDPELLERRKQVGPGAEQSAAQRVIISVAILTDFGVMAFAAVDHRMGWSTVPAPVSIIGDALVVIGFAIFLMVFKVNSFSGSSIQVVEGQTVVSSGPYALVRHPMYVGVLTIVTAAPLALGSWWGLLIHIVVVPMLMWRILDEESVLKRDLDGYADYTQQVRFRLVPYLW